MVKFSKELEAKLIPEWEEAFVNYWQLKKYAKRIKDAKMKTYLEAQQDTQVHNYTVSILDPIRCVINKITSRSNTYNDSSDIIQVTNTTLAEDEEDLYQTELVQLFSEEDELKEFFEQLDQELNKVNQFYRLKESEFVGRGEALLKQIQILLDLKQKMNDCRHRNQQEKCNCADRVLYPRSFSPLRGFSDFPETVSDADESISSTTQNHDMSTALGRDGVIFNTTLGTKTKKRKPKTGMGINISSAHSTISISALTSMLWEDLVNNPRKDGPGDFITRKKIQYAEKMLRAAFVELYRGFGLLKTYSSLNMISFTKILKKFDKVANQQASGSYLRVVKGSHFISSDKVVKLGDEVETIFTKQFANNDRKKAMKYLRPQMQKASHMITFLVGVFTGCFITLFSVYGILAHISGLFSGTSESGYIETVYPIFSMFALFSLHMFLYGCNLFMWKSTRINCNFIFEFSPSTALRYRGAFLICTFFMTAVVGAMVIHLLMKSHDVLPQHVDTIPGILLLSFVALLICPLNIFYRPTRYCFLRILRNVVCSPFYRVLMVDFFMADQLTSQIPLLRHMESTACYFLAGSFKTQRYHTCHYSKSYKVIAYVVSFAPYYWRAMQCARRWFDEGQVDHLANLGKYVSALLAACARLTFAMQPNRLWWSMVIITSSLATVYQLYWDFVKDWGLFNKKSKNLWLRDDLILKKKSIYYLSIVLNLVLRLVWVQTLLKFNVDNVESRLLDFLMASLEIIRRGHWNFYRLENEHLNNVGKFRAVKTVPLPFREIDSDG